ncbi:4914_t:CDS:2 [Dentiscutata erythropus]|uniref:4914_t:CDS:1 n=1 Tax=Dentiscutata erythropus TaxID=1348616 RepID=A0A9N9GF77_9GLOM|nr:4914_t:CDS:2 [Dentiscutata erythropus]
MDPDNRNESQTSQKNVVLAEVIIDGVLDPFNRNRNSENAETSQPAQFSVELFTGSPPPPASLRKYIVIVIPNFPKTKENLIEMRPWSTTEAAYLLKLNEKHGRDWKIISELLGRTQKDCYNK